MRRLFAVSVLLFLVLSLNAFSQTTNATLGGTVSDSTGALIPGVTVTASNTQTGIVATVVTNETGAYQFASLQTGTYRVTAELPGFQTQAYNAVAMGISQQVRLNFTLQVGSVTTAVDVSVAADTLIATTSASVGTVLPEYKVRDLPLGNRDALDLVGTTAGVFISGTTASFAGAPTGMTVTTRDGIAVNDGRYSNGVYSQTYTSTDMVDEVRIIVAPADAETGRGSGQVQMTTRAGTNQFRGALFWTNRNPVWDANTFANNFNGVEKSYLNRNQFGGRLGGPIIRNKTFFFFLYEGMRSVQREVFTATVLTATARQGIYRYFPGVQSANANANTPTVDFAGNPTRPANATDALQSFSVFTRDPNRPGFDPSGWVPRILEKMPLPNDFRTVGDGLNTAGYRWVRRYSGDDTFTGIGENYNRDQINLRIDHNFNANHKLNLVGSREDDWSDSAIHPWPFGFNGVTLRNPLVYTGNFVSTLSPTVVNELRFGLRKSKMLFPQAWDVPGPSGEEAQKFLGRASNGFPYRINPTLFPDHVWTDDGASRTSTPLWTYGDTLSWTQGKHAFKGGAEVRIQSSNSATNGNVIPQVTLGAAGIAVAGITNATLPGINNADATRAQQLLTDLSGSASNITQAFTINDTKDLIYKDYRDEYWKFRNLHQNEFSWFFKDDWKIRPDLTLNLGVRHEWYGTPWESKGLVVAPIGGGNAMFGYSGRSWADWFRPGQRGDQTVVEFVGKNSPNPDKTVYPDDWNNFAPAVGLSWSVPWFGKDKTVVRMGYGWGYQGRFSGGGGGTFYSTLAAVPGLTQTATHPITTVGELNLNNIVLPIPERAPGGQISISSIFQRNESFTGYDNNMVTPYIQNFSVELQRELMPNLTLELRYVGTKGTKLFDTINLNTPNTIENGILDAFSVTVAGGDAPLFDQMLRGLNLGLGAVNGTTVTGSASLRQNAATRGFLANANPAGLAAYFNNTPQFTNQIGGILRNGGLPENFVVANPQYASASISGNGSNSTYHSLNVSVQKRLSNGFTNQTTYTWSRTIGTSVVNPRDRNNKTLLGQHRTHDIRSNGTYELPFGPGRPLLSDAPGWVSRLVERWQLGGIFSMNSGSPLTLTGAPNPYGIGNNFPDMLVELPKSFGEVKIQSQPGVITYFDGLQQVADPGRAAITNLQSLQGVNSNLALSNTQNQIVLANAPAGKIGNLGQSWFEGPGRISLDANLIKSIRIDESKQFVIRLDAINVLNHANFGNPTLSINSTGFGRIALPTTGNRQFTFTARMEF